MSYDSAIVARKIDQRAEVIQGTALDTVVYYAYDAGVDSVIASATVRILDPGGTVKVNTTTADVFGNAINLTQAWPAAAYEFWEDYVFEVTWVDSNGTTFSDRMYFDVVRTKLQCVIADEHLLDVYPDLHSHLASIGETSALKALRRGWSMLLDRIRAGRNRPSLILDRARLVNPALQAALYFACASLAREVGDLWDKRADEHMKLYEKFAGGLGELKYDRDEDGLAGQNETKVINRRPFSV